MVVCTFPHQTNFYYYVSCSMTRLNSTTEEIPCCWWMMAATFIFMTVNYITYCRMSFQLKNKKYCSCEFLIFVLLISTTTTTTTSQHFTTSYSSFRLIVTFFFTFFNIHFVTATSIGAFVSLCVAVVDSCLITKFQYIPSSANKCHVVVLLL